MEDKRVSIWGATANITADGEEGGRAAHVGVVEVDAPVASRTSGDEAVPGFNTDRTAASTDTLLTERTEEKVSTWCFTKNIHTKLTYTCKNAILECYINAM